MYKKASIECRSVHGLVVRALDSRSRAGREFNSQPLQCQVTTVGKSFSHTCASVTEHYTGNLAPSEDDDAFWLGI